MITLNDALAKKYGRYCDKENDLSTLSSDVDFCCDWVLDSAILEKVNVGYSLIPNVNVRFLSFVVDFCEDEAWDKDGDFPDDPNVGGWFDRIELVLPKFKDIFLWKSNLLHFKHGKFY